MRPVIRTLALVAATGLVSGEVLAQSCPGGTTRVTALTTLLNGNTLCAASGNDTWQEQHRSGGELWDFKLGANSTIDPTAKVGIWKIVDGPSSTLNHDYGAGGSFTWAVCQVGTTNTYTLVGNITITGATVQTGQVGCAAAARGAVRAPR